MTTITITSHDDEHDHEQSREAEREQLRRHALAQIRQYPDVALRMTAHEVTEFDDYLAPARRADEALMHDAQGSGSRRTQVGVLQRLFVFDPGRGGLHAVVNPRLVELSEEQRDRRGGLPFAPGRSRPGRARDEGDARRPGPERRRGAIRARGLERPRRPARARPPGRRADHRPHRRGAPQGGARGAAAADRPALDAHRRRRDGSVRRRRARAARRTRTRSPSCSPGPTRRAGAAAGSHAPPAKEAPSGSGSPCYQPERPELPDEPVDAVVVCAYGLLIPAALLEQRALAERPSVAAAALARRGAGRARDPGRRRGDRRHDPRDRRGARRRPDRGPGGVPDRRRDDAGAVFARSAEVAARLLDGVLPAPAFTPQTERGRDLRREDRARRSRARPRRSRSMRGGACARSRRTSAPGRRSHGRRVTIWRAPGSRTARSFPTRCSRRASGG